MLDYTDGEAVIEQRNNFKIGDELEIISPNSMGESLIVTEIYDEEGNSRADASLVKQILRLPCPTELQKGDMLRLRLEE